LTALIEERFCAASAKRSSLATGLIVEQALEEEAGNAIGRDCYEHRRVLAKAIGMAIGAVG
jgi:hypothetical protein